MFSGMTQSLPTKWFVRTNCTQLYETRDTEHRPRTYVLRNQTQTTTTKSRLSCHRKNAAVVTKQSLALSKRSEKRDNPTCTADDNAAPAMLQWQQMQAPITPERPVAGPTKPNTPDEVAGIRTRLGFGPPWNGHPLFHGSR